MPTGVDHDHDGDYDHFDEQHQALIDNPEIALGEAAEERTYSFFNGNFTVLGGGGGPGGGGDDGIFGV